MPGFAKEYDFAIDAAIEMGLLKEAPLMTEIYMVRADDQLEGLIDDLGALTERGEWHLSVALQLLAKTAFSNSKNKGFHEEPRNFPEELALVHSEVSETLEEHRDGHGFSEHYYRDKINGPTEHALNPITGELNKPEGIPAEIADIIIRLGDICGNEDRPVDISRAVIEKLRYNATRPHKNGKLY